MDDSEIARAIGQLEGTVKTGFENMESHIKAVSEKASKAKTDLETHEKDPKAHSAVVLTVILTAIGIAGTVGVFEWMRQPKVTPAAVTR